MAISDYDSYVNSNNPVFLVDSKDCKKTMGVYDTLNLAFLQKNCPSLNYSDEEEFIVGEADVGAP